MITYIRNSFYSYDGNRQKSLIQIACLSSDTKPTDDIVTGSVAVEVDTGDVYLFDEASADWNKMCSIKE